MIDVQFVFDVVVVLMGLWTCVCITNCCCQCFVHFLRVRGAEEHSTRGDRAERAVQEEEEEDDKKNEVLVDALVEEDPPHYSSVISVSDFPDSRV